MNERRRRATAPAPSPFPPAPGGTSTSAGNGAPALRSPPRSTVLFVVLVVWLVPKTSGWQDVRESFFDWSVFRDSFRPILRAFWLDIRVFLVCAPCIIGVALVVATARNIRAPALYPLRLVATVYTDVVRGVPVILWITMLGFGIPGAAADP